MGRRKRRQRRHSLASFAHARFVDDVIDQEKARAEQKQYATMAKAIEDDHLSRTVFITNVMDLNNSRNLDALRFFMEENYGRVDRCVKDKFNSRQPNGRYSRFPPGRVTFATRQGAENIFNGKTLRDAGPVVLSCPTVGYRGTIRARPSHRYDGMLEGALTGNRLSFQSDSLSLGHWLPSFEDVYLSWSLRNDETSSKETTTNQETEIFHREAVLQRSLSVSIDLSTRKIEITSTESVTSVSVMTVRFKELRNQISLCKDGDSGKFFLVFATKWPPKLEKMIMDRRQRDNTFECIFSNVVGRCLGIMIELSSFSLPYIQSHRGNERLRKFGVFPKGFTAQEAVSLKISNIRRPVDDYHRQLTSMARRSRRIAFLSRSIIDSGKTSWYHAIDRNFSQDGLPMNFLDLVLWESDDEQRLSTLEMDLQRMLGDLGSGCTAFPCHVFSNLSSSESNEAGGDECDEIPNYCVNIHRVLLTPTHVRCIGMEINVGNRVVRYFTSRHGFASNAFVRVRIAEENGKKLFSNELGPNVEEMITSTVRQGVKINGEVYHFLAYSSSQLKEYSFWMVNTKYGWDVQKMRACLGDFSMCTTISKYAARFGQCLSSTFNSEDLPHNLTTIFKSRPLVLTDIEASARVGKLHSDGTGLISRSLMNEVLRTYPNAPPDLNRISIIQIRYGGAKGTLSAWNHLGRTDIHLRKSMVKFKAKYDNIEICSVGTSRPYFLNRNLILLLRVHNVDESTFLDLQRGMLDCLDGMLLSNDNARKTLPKLSGPDAGIVNSLLDVLDMGTCPSQDPFLFGCLQAIRLHHIFALRKKARILVEKGVVLMGGMDESGKVPEGCVYIQFTKPGGPGRNSESVVVNGGVMVTKHPVMHPGDVRMLCAVDIPSLADHSNVILFSKHGSRPEADKMAGSDLDGDEFAVTWDTRLFLNDWNECSEGARLAATVRKLESSNFLPMSYVENSAATSVKVPPNPSEYTDAMITHLINLIKNDNLGRIAMLWQDYASRYTANCEECLRLAELHSTAVDFPKSGIPAQLPDDLLLPKDFPVAHWREKKGANQTFHCPSIIGKLYDEAQLSNSIRGSCDALAGRVVDKYGQVLRARTQKAAQPDNYCDYSIPRRLGYSQLSECLKSKLTSEALSNYREFEAEVSAMMNKYGIRSEGELFTGCVRKFNKLQSSNQGVIAEECRTKCRELRRAHRQIFFETVREFALETAIDRSNDDEIGAEDVEHLVCSNDESRWSKTLRSWSFYLSAAYYLITYDRSFSHLLDDDGRGTLFVFPWLVADIMNQRHRNTLIGASSNPGQTSFSLGG